MPNCSIAELNRLESRLILNTTSLIDSVNNVSDEQNIADMWQEHFRKLYKSCSNTTHRDELCAKVKCEQYMNNVVNLHAVSVYDVLAAMSELQTGKAVGRDGIPAEAFVYGGHRLAVLLSCFSICALTIAIYFCIYFLSYCSHY